jgi:nucleotide-binding universal stress UspA family protein
VSAQVVAQALEVAGDAEVDVVHVLGSEVERRLRKAKLAGVDVGDWLERQRSEAGRHLDLLLSTLAAGRQVGRRLLPGLASAVICQEIDECQADLIVLGRHGYGGGLQDWMLGSVSKDVALAAGCDVLLIQPRGAS